MVARLPGIHLLARQSLIMDVRFIAQPYEDGTDLRDFLDAVSKIPSLHTVRIIVAWAKRSGMTRAAANLTAIRDAGGKVLAIVGVSEGGATQQGLQALIDQTDQTWVFHDKGRTFHPKVYLAESSHHALLLVGSHNLTAGGLAWNYEAGLWCELDLTDPNDAQVRADVVGYFDRLKADTGVCVPLDNAALAAILADASLLIQNEDARQKVASSEPDAPEESDSAAESDATVFGKSQEKKRMAPSAAKKAGIEAPADMAAPATGAVAGTLPTLNIVKRWFKRLDGTAAQWPPAATTKRTGNLRLSQEQFAIDHTKYFHEVFFGGLAWTPTGTDPQTEEVWIPMETEAAGDYLGVVNIRVSYAAKRIANQGNVSTVLHWGDLGLRLRQNNYVGKWVTLERSGTDVFLLTIADQPTGPFAY
jgi:hypothetical protein